MAKATLPTNYRDDILNVSTEGKRKYRMNYNDDGTVSFVDVTPYDQEGSDFGAGDINATNEAVNQSFDKSKLIRDIDAISALTQEGYAPDALALKEVNNSLVANIYVGDDGKLHKVQGGADSVLPFSSGINFKTLLFFYNTNKFDIPTNFGNELTIIVTAYSGSGSSYSKKMVTINSATNATFETIDIYSANIGTNYLSTAIYKINIIDVQKPELTISLSSNNICVSILA